MTNESSNIVVLPDLKDINARAAEWLVLLEDGDVSAEDLAAFRAWRDVSEKHREAFDRLAELWGGFERIKALDDLALAEDTAALLAKDTRWKLLRRRSLLAGAAASALVAVGVGVDRMDAPLHGHYGGVYRTGIGEQKTIALPDGSTISLNTNSRVDVAFSPQARDIRLVQGEAYFDVKPDKQRPFAVRSGDRWVVAVGTAFTVRLNNDRVDVTVTKGRVALFTDAAQTPLASSADSRTPSPTAPVTEIGSGQTAVIDKAVEHVDVVAPDVLARRLSWRQGVLAFSGEPLSDVVADVSRYTDVKILIEGDDLRNLPVAGYFKIGEAGEMLEALEIMTGLKAEHVGPKLVRFARSRDG